MIEGRLGLESAQIPHKDRHGLMWLEKGNLYIEAGALRFKTAGFPGLQPGDYTIPHQTVSYVILGPGTTISHDACRILARHNTGAAFVGTDGVRLYACLPPPPDQAKRARVQAMLWSNEKTRTQVARVMYQWRFGVDEDLSGEEIKHLRAREGAKIRRMYQNTARRYRIPWKKRDYNRANHEQDDIPNQAINHASAAVRALAQLAVVVTGTIPQLGFVHHHSGEAFALDIADLFRSLTVDIAFEAAGKKIHQKRKDPIERMVRQSVGQRFKQAKTCSHMIDRIKELFDGYDDSGDLGPA